MALELLVIGRARADASGCAMQDKTTLREQLGRENWERWLNKLTLLAGKMARRWRWRGAKDGRMPRGHDPETIVQDVVLAVWKGESRLRAGYTEEELEGEFRRLIWGKTWRLSDRSENKLVRSEWDFLPLDEEGNPRSIFDGLMAKTPNPSEEVMAKEKQTWGEEVKEEFERSLKAEPELLAVWGCLRAGVCKREEIAERLGISVAEVTSRRKRLERRGAEFVKRREAGAAG